jgi:cbb3-type cytochrome oxidase subunit 3
LTPEIVVNFLAQLDPLTVKTVTESADFLASKDLRWLFFAIGIAFLLFFLAVIKFLLARDQKYSESRDAREKELTNQLTEQRNAHASAQEKLMAYITGDHMKCVEVQSKVTDALEKLTDAIQNLHRPT